MAERITSVRNALVQSVVDLHTTRARQERQQILVESRHPVGEACRAGLTLIHAFVREDQMDAIGDLPIEDPIPVTEAVMARLATTDSPPPILAVFTSPDAETAAQILQAPEAFYLGCWGLQDPGNLGTLLRSACAFDVTSLILFGSHVDPYHPKVIRASAGLVFRLPVLMFDTWESFEALQPPDAPLSLWGADAHGGVSYQTATYGPRAMLLLGSEAHGLPSGLPESLQRLHIPMVPDAESLNVAVAGAIVLSDRYARLTAFPGNKSSTVVAIMDAQSGFP